MWVCKNCGSEINLISKRINETKVRLSKDLKPDIILDASFVDDDVFEYRCSNCGIFVCTKSINDKENILRIAKWIKGDDK